MEQNGTDGTRALIDYAAGESQENLELVKRVDNHENPWSSNLV